jgi:hypothetical protein
LTAICNIEQQRDSEKDIDMLHKYKYEKKYGALLPCFVLHHIDGDKLNNRLNNLQPLAQRQHAALHLEI